MASKIEPIKNLLAIGPADQWKDFLFSIQTSLLNYGHFAGMNEKGYEEFATKAQGLHDFFTALQLADKEK